MTKCIASEVPNYDELELKLSRGKSNFHSHDARDNPVSLHLLCVRPNRSSRHLSGFPQSIALPMVAVFTHTVLLSPIVSLLLKRTQAQHPAYGSPSLPCHKSSLSLPHAIPLKSCLWRCHVWKRVLSLSVLHTIGSAMQRRGLIWDNLKQERGSIFFQEFTVHCCFT